MSDVNTINGYAALYANIMAEVKQRHEAILTLINPEKAKGLMPTYALSESCYLQLRLICELIALGCLVAHGDIPATRSGKLKSAWNAEFIISALSKLHPNFYPHPGVQVVHPDGSIEIMEQKEPYLSKQEFKRLYAETGLALHRGAVHKVSTLEYRSCAEIRAWSDKIRNLLTHHQIEIADSDLEIWCIMHGKDDGRVHTNVMRRDPP